MSTNNSHIDECQTTEMNASSDTSNALEESYTAALIQTLTDKFKEARDMHREAHEMLRENIVTLRENIAALRENIATLTENVATLTENVATITENAATHKNGVVVNNETISGMQDRIAMFENQSARIGGRLVMIREFLDESIGALEIVVTDRESFGRRAEIVMKQFERLLVC